MPNFTAGTSFTDGVTNDVTALKLNALVADAVPTSSLSLNSTTGTIATFNSTTGTIATLNSTTGTIATLNSTTGTIATLNSTTGTIPTLVATTLITTGTGTAAAPAIVPTGDANTGIFFPAADTIAFSEGGAEAMRIDSSGNVGIGTASPAVKLTVDSGSVALGAVLNSTNAVGSQFRMDNSGTPFGYIGTPNGILGSGGATGLAIRSENILAFGSGGATERLRIDSSGRVGIGTASPAYGLDVSGGINSYGLNVTGLGGFQNGASKFGVDNNGGTTRLYSSGPDSSTRGAFDFRGTDSVGALDRSHMVIDLNGNVGIGTASPSAKLELSTDSAKKPSTNTWTIASDQRLKTNITNADNDRCYEIVKQVPLKRYTWRSEVYSEGQVKDRSKLGWIAQDVEAVFPKAVGTNRFAYNQVFENVVTPELDSDGNTVLDDNGVAKTKTEKRLVSEDVIEDCKDLNSDQIYAAMYGTIQKLIEKVEFLESKVAVLEAA
jgi:hypothetical protein